MKMVSITTSVSVVLSYVLLRLLQEPFEYSNMSRRSLFFFKMLMSSEVKQKSKKHGVTWKQSTTNHSVTGNAVTIPVKDRE